MKNSDNQQALIVVSLFLMGDFMSGLALTLNNNQIKIMPDNPPVTAPVKPTTLIRSFQPNKNNR